MKIKICPGITPMIGDVKNEFYHSKLLHGEGFGRRLWIAVQLAGLLENMYFTLKEKQYFDATW